jgi:DNA-binding MarR family transcriptional regulator
MELNDCYYRDVCSDSGSRSSSRTSVALDNFEILILKCIKSKAKSEKEISKQVKMNIPIVSQLITDLMLKGFIERTVRRRIFFTYTEYFSMTLEGLMALEIADSKNNNTILSSQLFLALKGTGQRIAGEIIIDSLTLKLILGTLKMAYRIVKLALK